MSSRYPPKKSHLSSNTATTVVPSSSNQVTTVNRSSTESGSPATRGHHWAEGVVRDVNSQSSMLRNHANSGYHKVSNHGNGANHSHGHKSNHGWSDRSRQSHSHHQQRQSNRSNMQPPSPGTPEMDAGSSDREEECPWSEHISSSKKPYFFNRKTNVSQWHMPPELAMFRQRKEQRRLANLAAAAASNDRSSSVPSQSSVQEISPPSTPVASRGATPLTLRSAHSTPGSAHIGHSGQPKALASLQVGGHHAGAAANVQLTPSTPGTKPLLMSQFPVPDSHIVSSPSVISAMSVNNVDLSVGSPALHPLQQATLLQKQFSEASRQGSITPGTPSPSVSGQLQLMQPSLQQPQQQQPPPSTPVIPTPSWTGPRIEARAVLASAPSILYSQPSLRFQQHPPQGAAFAEHYSRSAISHLQAWPTEGLERQSMQLKKDHEHSLLATIPRLTQQLHHYRSVSRALSLSSKVSEAKLRSLSRQREELEEQLGMNTNS